MKAWRLMVGLCVAFGLVALGWWALETFFPEAYVDIDQAQLQARLDARFPQKNCALMLACVTLADPVVRLSEGSPRIGLAADVTVSLGHRQIPGKVAFSGTLRYVRYQGDFYFDDVQVDDFSLEGLPPEYVEVVKARGPGAVRRALEGHPVYTLRGDNAREALARLAVRDVRVVNGKVRVSFVRFGG